MWYVYIAEFRNGWLYTGITTDVKRRIKEHNNGSGAKSLRGKGPVILAYHEEFESEIEARKREYAIKQWSRANKLKLIYRRTKGLP